MPFFTSLNLIVACLLTLARTSNSKSENALILIGCALPLTDTGVNVIPVISFQAFLVKVRSDVEAAVLITFTALPAIFNVSTARSAIFTLVTPLSPMINVLFVPLVTTSIPSLH